MKIVTFTVPEALPSQKLLNYAAKVLPEIPFHCLREAFEKRDVKAGGVRQGREAFTQGGTQVNIYLPEEGLRKLPIVYQSEHFVLIHKPAGIPCESNREGERTVSDLVKETLHKNVFLCHRLDAPTEGLLLLAFDEGSQELAQETFRRQMIRKEYVCLVKGTPFPEHALLTAYYTKDALHGRVKLFQHSFPEARDMVTEYWVLKAGETSRLRIRLHTGRTHQIRAHMAWIGHPVLGDDEYGDRKLNREKKASRLKLCSVSMYIQTNGMLAELDGKLFETKPSF